MAFAVGKSPSISLIRPADLEKECYKASLLLEKTQPLLNASIKPQPVWTVYSTHNFNSYWPYSYYHDHHGEDAYWFDRFQQHSPLYRRDLFSRWLYNADYHANPHYWSFPYANWTRYRGYLMDNANPSYYAREYYYMTGLPPSRALPGTSLDYRAGKA